MRATVLCTWREWDSQFFGYRIAQVAPHRLDAPQLREVERWCAGERIDCLYFLADSDAPDTIRLVERARFQCVDIRVHLTSDSSASRPAVDSSVRPLAPDDVPEVRAIARRSLRHSRFYFDDHFSAEQREGLYDLWARQSCEGQADVVLVSGHRDRVVGFVTGHVGEDGAGSIGLLAVDGSARGAGVGGALVGDVLGWFAGRGISRVSVVAQGRNPAAVRVYERCGFRLDSLHLWYHRWFSDDHDAEVISVDTP